MCCCNRKVALSAEGVGEAGVGAERRRRQNEEREDEEQK